MVKLKLIRKAFLCEDLPQTRLSEAPACVSGYAGHSSSPSGGVLLGVRCIYHTLPCWELKQHGPLILEVNKILALL